MRPRSDETNRLIRIAQRIMKSAALPILCLMIHAVLCSQDKGALQLPNGIAEYPFSIVQIPVDTITLDDSARVVLELSLDCTNQVTRFETRFDTIGDQSRVVLSVYGTYVSGPFRPLCPAKVVDKEFFIFLATVFIISFCDKKY